MIKLLLILLLACQHPSIYDAYQQARFLPVKITRWEKNELEYLYEDRKEVVMGTLYADSSTRFPKDFDPSKGRYMVYYCSLHYTLYEVKKINE